MARPKLEKGFKALKNLVKDDQKKLRGLRNCLTCKSLYADEGESTEYCHNNSVTEFDMVEEETKKYCTFWRPTWHKEESF